MDGNVLIILGGFIGTWSMIIPLYYKVGKIEQKVSFLYNNHPKNNRGGE